MKMSKPELYEITWINLKNIMLKKTKKEHVVFDFIYIKLKILKIMPLKMRRDSDGEETQEGFWEPC